MRSVETGKIDSMARQAVRALPWPLAGVFLVFTALMIGQLCGGFRAVSLGVALVVFGAFWTRGSLKSIWLVNIGAALALGIWYGSLTPSNDRDWVMDTSRLPQIADDGSMFRVKGLRDFRWRSTERFEAFWHEEVYDMDALNQLDVLVEPLDGSQYVAHVMMRFGFADGKRLVVSVEARRERGEVYGLLAGMARQFELIYVFATEQDILDLRINHRGSRILAYPIRADNASLRRLLMDLAEGANALIEQPSFYATVRDNCTTTLLKHVNQSQEAKIGIYPEILFPAKLGGLLYRLDLVDTERLGNAVLENGGLVVEVPVR